MNDTITTPPLAYTVEEFAVVAKIGRTRIYAAIKEGKLRARKYGKRTLILLRMAARSWPACPSCRPPDHEQRGIAGRDFRPRHAKRGMARP